MKRITLMQFLAVFSVSVIMMPGSTVTYASGGDRYKAKVKAADALCQNQATEDPNCEAFILGFLQGALITDSAIVKSYKETEENNKEVRKKWSLADRAMRTRLGLKNEPVTQRAGYCLPKSQNIYVITKNVASKLKKRLRSQNNAATMAAQQVYLVLQDEYPC